MPIRKTDPIQTQSAKVVTINVVKLSSTHQTRHRLPAIQQTARQNGRMINEVKNNVSIEPRLKTISCERAGVLDEGPKSIY